MNIDEANEEARLDYEAGMLAKLELELSLLETQENFDFYWDYITKAADAYEEYKASLGLRV